MTVRFATAMLLCGTALSTTAVAGLADSALAQATPAGPAEAVTVIGNAGHKTADGVTGLQPGGGLIKIQVAPKSISTVTKDYILKQAPASSPFMLVQLLPGANVAEVDPWGLSGGSLSLRGLDNTEMAFIWEGMPIADVGVYTTYPSEFADTENLDELTLQQGSSNIDTPTINGSGGLFTFHDRDPTDKFGGLIDYGYGSYKYNREFARVDTGLIGNSGIKAFVSISNQHDRSWRGPGGPDDRLHTDWKLVKEWGEGNRVALVGAYQSAVQNSYTSPTLAQWGAQGRSFNFDGTYTYGDTNYWKLNRNPYHNFEMSAPMHFRLTNRLTADVTPYMWHGYGNGTIAIPLPTDGNLLGTEPVNQSLNLANAQDGSAPVLLAFQDNQYRSGLSTKLNYQVGNNRLYAGWWFDYSNDHDYQTFSPVSLKGEPSSIWGDQEIVKLADGRPYLGQDIQTVTTINTLFLGDEFGLFNNRLKIDAGFKEAIIRRDGTNMLPGPQYKAIINDAQPLPAISAHYQLDVHNQLFASVSTNFRSPVNTTLYNTYGFDGSVAFRGNTRVADEFSIAEEFGYRYTGNLLVGSVTYFHYNFTNRQISSAVAGTNNSISTDINAGGQTSDGIDFEAGLRPIHHFRPYVSGQYLHTSVDNDIQAGGDYLPTSGKDAIRSPHFIGAVGLDFDDGTLFANWNMRYIGQQYSTFMNDEKIPAFYEMGAAVGVRLPDIGPAKTPTLQLNLVNLTDNKFLSGINSVSTNALSTVGKFGTTIGGSAPSYFIGEGFAAIATVKVGF
ncbi:TonB-dependent receptor [Lichenicola cladoniae]|uniref:TonB-dependent receptor n=1 Tax=Lichenicola cladoniae TaxID=1484109 RepID=A0A6M8HN43_9PROT|nr:TonB-dependent receptor [Lichenicola cladoniae]NPD67188.1 TonB-dependent receptor [Acetobacteraceae bacterium]QKE89707.1 TonB-dependent receptor [Lichenicola cladoniae]